MTANRPDARLVPVAVATWLAAAVGVGWSLLHAVIGSAVLVLAGLAAWWWSARLARRSARTALALGAVALVVAAGALAIAGLRVGATREGAVTDLAVDGARVRFVGVVSADPVLDTTAFGTRAIVGVTATEVATRDQVVGGRVPLSVFGDDAWQDLRVGDRVAGVGSLQPSDRLEDAAVLRAEQAPDLLGAPGLVWRLANAARAAIADAASLIPTPQGALVPALVDGDDAEIPDDLAADFTATGLTHLLAVSGSNLTLVLAAALLLARWAGGRGAVLTAVGVGTVVCFVVVARPEPSVLRAAAMGVVGLAGLSGGGRRGVRALCAATVGLLLLDPWLARSAGFVLSVVATAGIVVLGRPWADALGRWLPRPLAEAVAVPLAAQLSCTPVVAAISGQVSLVAVFANIAAAPAVGPTTVLGLAAGLLDLVHAPAGRLLGWCAGVPAWWIVTVARHAADLAGATLPWQTTGGAIAGLAALCAGAGWLAPKVLARPSASVLAAVALVLVVVRPWGRLGWPPEHWLVVMCDVGQGDAFAVNAGPGAAVVIDTGPDPRLVDRCLDDLGVRRVPAVILTHFHADHVNGLPGLLDGRQVEALLVSPASLPPDGAAAVRAWAAEAGVECVVPAVGQRWEAGETRWEVVGPPAATARPVGVDPRDGSAANNASIVVRLVVGGHRFLFTGDAEPEEESALLAMGAKLRAEVVKVSHHGSSRQVPAFYQATGAGIALVSVGEDNDYGHPAAATLELVDGLGMEVFRTDVDGAVAVVADGAGLAVATSDG